MPCPRTPLIPKGGLPTLRLVQSPFRAGYNDVMPYPRTPLIPKGGQPAFHIVRSPFRVGV